MIIAIIISLVLGFCLGYVTRYGMANAKEKVKDDETIVKETLKKL